MMHGSGYSMGQLFFPGFGIIIQIVFLVLFLVIVIWLLNSGNIHSGKKESAKDILDKRLANGEISSKEYKKILKDIGEKNIGEK